MDAVSNRIAVTINIVFAIPAQPDIGNALADAMERVQQVFAELLPSAPFGENDTAPVTLNWRPIIEERKGKEQ